MDETLAELVIVNFVVEPSADDTDVTWKIALLPDWLLPVIETHAPTDSPCAVVVVIVSLLLPSGVVVLEIETGLMVSSYTPGASLAVAAEQVALAAPELESAFAMSTRCASAGVADATVEGVMRSVLMSGAVSRQFLPLSA